MLVVVVEVAMKRLLRAALVVVVWLWLVQNNDRKRKTLPQRITARRKQDAVAETSVQFSVYSILML